MTDLELPKRMRKADKIKFAEQLEALQKQVGFKVSARGWAYEMETFRLITKSQFDKVENLINDLRKGGYLPVDFTAEEEGRKFSGVENPEETSPIGVMRRLLSGALRCEEWYTPDWWDGEEYYIQMIVEKIDLKTLFKDVCVEYHIPIATGKGWQSILCRAEYSRRFKEAEEKGLRCVLLYAGDHDADGLRISDFLRGNLQDLANIHWEDGTEGYDPSDLIIDRFGLNYDFIIENNLTWIDNLETGAKSPCKICGKPKSLADPHHPNHRMPYVQKYLKEIGERKCEANALVIRPEQGRELCREAIVNYLGEDALDRFGAKRQAIRDIVSKFRDKTGLTEAINEAIKIIDEETDEE